MCDVGLARADDPAILEWAAVKGRILLTQDRDTMPQFAYERLEEGLPLPGVIILPDGRGVRSVVDEIVLLLVASEPTEWQNQVVFLPL